MALKVVREVVVVAISGFKTPFFKAQIQLLNIAKWIGLFACLCLSPSIFSATLAPDSVDALYHGYDGGGMEIDGPFIVLRKGVGDKVSLNGHYYVDSVSAASIDVVSFASPYKEERTEYSVGADFLHDKTIMSLGYTNSEENDFTANTVFFSLSQDFFGDLTTLNMGYSRGKDEVGMIQSDYDEEINRQNYKLGLSQVITKNMLLGFDIEAITDEGELNNPYRRYRYIDATEASGYGSAVEEYPETRTSRAAAIRTLYYLPYRASVKGEYRYFNDSWGIQAHTFELQYVHPIGSHWTVEGRYRKYRQTQADFYKDIFPYQNAEEFMARDKELSQFSNYTLGFGVSYQFLKGAFQHIDRLKLTVLFDYLDFKYDNFRDLTKSEPTNVGNEPLYGFDAWVTRISVTMEY